MIEASEEKILQILRDQEPVTLAQLALVYLDAPRDEIEKILWDLLYQNRIHRNPKQSGEFWYFGGIKGGTPPKFDRTQDEINLFASHCASYQLTNNLPIKLCYIDGNPHVITATLSSNHRYELVEAYPALPESIAKCEPIRNANPISGYIGVRVKVKGDKEPWVIVYPKQIFKPMEETMPETQITNNQSSDLRNIPLAQIKTNPQIRRFFNQEKLNELAASIKAQGLIHPITVRPVGKEFELIAGERRYRASKIAGLPDIAAVVRNLDDRTALEIQVTENVQRDDLHPIEEAEGFFSLKEKNEMSEKDIADKVGKSLSHVHKRLSLCRLPEIAKQIFIDGLISVRSAYQIARLANPDDMAELAKEIKKNENWHNDEQQISRIIRNRYLRLLKDAPFSTGDKTLVEAAGSCNECTKRTGCQTMLFDNEFKKEDSCLDQFCYNTKREAHIQREIEKAKKAGSKVLTGKDAEALYPHGSWISSSSGFVETTEKVYQDDKNRSFQNLVGKDGPAPTLVVDKNGNLHKVFERKEVAPIIKEKHGINLSGRSTSDPKEAERRRKEKQEKAARKIVLGDIFDAIRQAAVKPDFLSALTELVVTNFPYDGKRLYSQIHELEEIKGQYGVTDYTAMILKHLNSRIPADALVPTPTQLHSLFEIIFAQNVYSWAIYGSGHPVEHIRRIYQTLGFDLDSSLEAAMQQCAVAKKANAKPEPKPSPNPKTSGKATKTPAKSKTKAASK